jgi:hypothetical protein
LPGCTGDVLRLFCGLILVLSTTPRILEYGVPFTVTVNYGGEEGRCAISMSESMSVAINQTNTYPITIVPVHPD